MKSKVSKMKSKVENQKPFDVVLNEDFGKYQKKGFGRNWFVPIVKEQSDMDNLIRIRNSSYPNYSMERNFPNILLDVNKDDEGNLISIYVLYQKGGKLFRVVSKKDYGVIKSRMEFKNGKYIPYDKCDLVPFDGTIEEYDYYETLIKSISYKDGKKDGESITYYKDWKLLRNENTNELVKEYYYEKTTFKNGKKNGEFENTKYGTKGNYLNNKKNGVWKDSYKNICKSLSTSHQSKFDLSQWDVKSFIKRNLGIFSDCDFDKLERVGTVFYVNDVLNGDFKIDNWEGKFELGLPNGVVTQIRGYNFKDVIISKLYVDGIIDTVVEYNSGDKEYFEETNYTINNYENGFLKTSISLSKNYYNKIPTELTSISKQHLNEDLFNSIVKTELNDGYTLESFLSEFEVMEVIEYNNDNYQRESKTIIQIGTTKLEYGFNNYGGRYLNRYLIEECGYPHFKVNGRNTIKNYTLLKSNEFGYQSDYHPSVYSLKEIGQPTKLFINKQLINETIGEETNPIVLEFEKKELQNLSEKMSSSYEIELKRKELEKQRELEQKQKEREEKGLSINSFPMD